VQTWSPSSSEVGDALGGHDRVNLEIHFVDITKQRLKYTWRL